VTSSKAPIEVIKDSSDDESDEDEEIDLERDEQGNYVVFKRTDEAEDDEELSEKFMALKSTKQIQILLVTLKTQMYHAQE
jgi:hypothetical protein